MNESRPPDINDLFTLSPDEARTKAILDDIAARPLDERAEAVEALVARLERELDASSEGGPAPPT